MLNNIFQAQDIFPKRLSPRLPFPSFAVGFRGNFHSDFAVDATFFARKKSVIRKISLSTWQYEGSLRPQGLIMKDLMQPLFPWSVCSVDNHLLLNQSEGSDRPTVPVMCQLLLDKISSFLPCCCCYSPVWVCVYALTSLKQLCFDVLYFYTFLLFKQNWRTKK